MSTVDATWSKRFLVTYKKFLVTCKKEHKTQLLFLTFNSADVRATFIFSNLFFTLMLKEPYELIE